MRSYAFQMNIKIDWIGNFRFLRLHDRCDLQLVR